MKNNKTLKIYKKRMKKIKTRNLMDKRWILYISCNLEDFFFFFYFFALEFYIYQITQFYLKIKTRRDLVFKKSEKLCRKYQIRTTGSVFFFYYLFISVCNLEMVWLPFLYIYVIELYYTLLRWWDKNVTKQQNCI